MSDELAFLKEIEASPEDRSARLVYADWLEERNDPRADLIRVEEEMRRVPIYSDRYWELKPRRNALRRKKDKAWLEQMRYGTDYEPVFGEVPDGWKERWRLLREFTERWYGIPMGDVGGRAREICKAERRLKLQFPPSIREWIAYGHDLRDRSRFGIILRDCYTVQVLPDLSALSLLMQAEGDIHWAVKLDNLRADDPPVDGYVLDYEPGHENRFVHDDREVIPHVTGFVFGHLTYYLSGQGGNRMACVQSSPVLLRQLKGAFPIRAVFDGWRVFEAINVTVRLRGKSLKASMYKHVPHEAVPPLLRELMKP